MVNNKIAQRAVAAGLSGLMVFGTALPSALAYSIKDFAWVSVNSADDGKYWKRLGGDTRYDTMKKIVEAFNEYEYKTQYGIYGKSSWSGYNYHSTAVLASGDNFPDALAANGLAGYLTNFNLSNNLGSNGAVPVILTKSGSLSSQAKDLLKNMQVQNVIIMGGTAAVSQDVEDAIAKMGIGVSRVAGADRQETSLKALQRITGNWKGRKGTYDIIIATGDNYADALSIAPYAYRMGTPIILTKKDGTLTDAQVAAIKDNDEIKEVLIVGGTSAVSDAVMGQIGTLKKNNVGVSYQRIAGVDRYETSAKIALFEVDAWRSYWTGFKGFTFDHAVVATGEKFPDALVGGQLAGGWGLDVNDFGTWMPCPLLLTKDGDTQAERVISQQISRQDVDVYTDTYVSFAEYVDTVFGWYGTSTDEFNALSNDSRLDTWYNWYSLNYDLKDEVILDLDGFYLSDRAIDESQKRDNLITPITVNASRKDEDWDTEIIRWIDTDYDFYGIILGGTAAVSNDKRDDLDDAVVFTGGTTNVYTDGKALPDTVVRFSNDWGIELDYSKLTKIDEVTSINQSTNLDGDGNPWYLANVEADVYAIRGTDSYVLYIPSQLGGAQAGRFMYVYRGRANTAFISDWI